MKKNDLNNKGYMLVEIIVSSVIALVMAYFLIDITIKLVNKNNDFYVESVLLTDKNIITKEIMDDINSKTLVKVDGNTDSFFDLTFDDGSVKNLIIDRENNTITYGEYKKQISAKLNVSAINVVNDNGVLTLSIPAYTNYSKEDYGINIKVPYAGEITVVYPELKCQPGEFAKKIMEKAENKACGSNGSGVCKIVSRDSENNEYQDYRYRGVGVNNYVSFNNDLYRIIGVFDENTHGAKKECLVKLISANSIGSYSLGVYNTNNTSGVYSSYKNDWTGNTTGVKANLNILLNEYFYNKMNTSTTYKNCKNWTYIYNGGSYISYNCSDIVGWGLSNGYQNYLQDATWYLYGSSGNGLSKQNFYLCERGQYPGCTGGKSGAYATSTTAKIGVMYPSDYMYASSNFSSTDTTTASGGNSGYGVNNWLFKGYEWTITPDVNTDDYVFFIGSSGYVVGDEGFEEGEGTSANGRYVRPSFYLKSSVKLKGGDGTFDNPYKLDM